MYVVVRTHDDRLDRVGILLHYLGALYDGFTTITIEDKARVSGWVGVARAGVSSGADALSVENAVEVHAVHRLALLRWAIACERLENSLQPRTGRPTSTQEDLLIALDIVRGAIDALETAYLAPGPE